MEKYKLIKDLPNAKAGEIFVIAADIGALVREHKQYSVLYSKDQLQENDILNPDKGWFEKMEIEMEKYGGIVPRKGDTYWYIRSYGDVVDDIWLGCEWDIRRFESGSAFWAKEEAEKELARRKAYVILKEDTKGFKPDWESLDTKWFVGYSRSLGGKLRPDWTQRDSAGVLYFSSMEDAAASIEAHEKEWRAWLGVEE